MPREFKSLSYYLEDLGPRLQASVRAELESSDQARHRSLAMLLEVAESHAHALDLIARFARKLKVEYADVIDGWHYDLFIAIKSVLVLELLSIEKHIDQWSDWDRN